MSRTLRVGVVMDPINEIKPWKDTTLRLMLEAQARGCEIHYMQLADLSIHNGSACGRSRLLQLRDDRDDWFTSGTQQSLALSELDYILMRKDPPFDMEFVNATHILELAQREGTPVINDPRGLRDIGEKLSIAGFPQFTPATLISRSMADLRAFLKEQQSIVVKPLDGMGGASIFRIEQGDQNASVIFETITEHETRYAMAQAYLPAISKGDKRILVINGEPYRHALARIPAAGELRGNLAAGGRGEGVDLTERDIEIASTVGAWLKERNMLFCGLDVIGDSLTEINVTSPTCLRELEGIYGDNIAALVLDAAEGRLH